MIEQQGKQHTLSYLLRRSGVWLLWGVAMLLAAPYFLMPYYTFPGPQPFAGTVWHNPYAGSSGQWLKSNFHLHAKAYGGLTDGNTVAHEIDSVYSGLGYDIVALSNYFSIDSLPQFSRFVYVPCYEHGFSIQKSHRLVIGAKEVDMLDAVLPQTVHIKQFLFNRLAPTCDVLVMAHPSFGLPSYTYGDMKKLGGYHCVEVLNHYRNSSAHWDSALSNGRAVWLIANDDSHDAHNRGETGVCWTMINAHGRSRTAVMSALRSGTTYGVHSEQNRADIALNAVRIVGDTLVIECDSTFAECAFIGQGGTHRQRDTSATTARYVLQPGDTYIRAVIRTSLCELYTNPVIRTHAGTPEQRTAEPDIPFSIFMWCVYILLFCASWYWIHHRATFQRQHTSSV